jgi:DNA primase
MDAKEEVRARLAIEDVIGDYVQLQRAGRNFKGLSPFTSEKTPSFFVSPDKQIWHDFSSNAGGDVFSFVMQAEGLDFRGALEFLARKAGVDLAMYAPKGDQQLAARKKRATEATELAMKYYQTCLMKNPHAVAYVVKARKLSKRMIASFGVGYAPQTGDAVIPFLQKRGFSSAECKDAGLTNRFGSDLFRGRMMISLQDQTGAPIGFTGRIIDDEPSAPKYLNTPQTIIYDKSRHIFGLSQAKEAIRQAGYAVVVEGNLDVISSHQAGFAMTVATAGTAMTEQHIKALQRLTSDIRLAYDADKAGIAATERAIGIAGKLGVDLRVISLPANVKDPDELLQKDPDLWRQAIEAARPALEWILDHYARQFDLTSASGKRAFTTQTLSLVGQLQDSVEREHYETKIAARIGMTLAAIRDKSGVLMEKAVSPKRRVRGETPKSSAPEAVHQDDLLAVMTLDVPSQELLTPDVVTLLIGDERQQLATYIAQHRGSTITEVPKDLHKIDTYVKIVVLRAEARYAVWNDADRYYEAARLVRQLEYEHSKQTRDDLLEQLRTAEDAGDDVLAHQLRERLNVLIKEIARGK